jgi:hypothetical protein
MNTWVIIITILACALLIYFWWLDRHGIDLLDGFERYPAGIVGRIMYALRLLAWIPGLAGMCFALFFVPMLIVWGLAITVGLFSPKLADAIPILPLTAVFSLAYFGFLVYQGRYGKGSAYYERRMRCESELQWLRRELGLAPRQSLRDRAKKILEPVIIIWIALLLLACMFQHHKSDPSDADADVFEQYGM